MFALETIGKKLGVILAMTYQENMDGHNSIIINIYINWFPVASKTNYNVLGNKNNPQLSPHTSGTQQSKTYNTGPKSKFQ
jgi:hypothetical protein